MDPDLISGRRSAAAAAARDKKKPLHHGPAFAAGGTVPPPLPALVSLPLLPAADSSADTEDTTIDVEIKGTCLVLEKSYFRLTVKAIPEEIRPQRVLQAALDRLVTLYPAGQITCDYVMDQGKAMRQDVTVQGIRTLLAVAVYEMVGRVALVMGDFSELILCLTQLHTILYPCNVSGGCQPEFVAYSLLHQSVHAHQGMHKALLHSMQEITPELAATVPVAHALEVSLCHRCYVIESYAGASVGMTDFLVTVAYSFSDTPMGDGYLLLCSCEAENWPACSARLRLTALLST